MLVSSGNQGSLENFTHIRFQTAHGFFTRAAKSFRVRRYYHPDPTDYTLNKETNSTAPAFQQR